MMCRWLFFGFLVCAATAGYSRTVDVRSGEHADFTRLVFNLPERIDYTLEQDDSRILLTFERAGLSFETDTVFERIPRTRLKEMKSTRNGIELLLNCECNARSFWYDESGLVVDLLNTTEPQEAVVLESPIGGALSEQSLPATEQVEPSAELARTLLFRRLDTQLGEDPAARIDAASDLMPSRDALLIEFGKAASQGLIDPIIRLDLRVPDPQNLETEVREEDLPKQNFPNQPPGHQMNLRAETAFDQAIQDTLREGLAPLLPDGCTAPHELDFAKWGNDEPFATQIALAHSALVDALDKPNPTAVLALARLYLYFGFGAEARELIAQTDMPSRKKQTLLTLSQIVETGQAEPKSPLHRQLECDPRVAIWSALAYAQIPENEPLDLDAILQGFIALPPHLRAHLGPKLAQRLLLAGYREESARVHRILARSNDAIGPGADLVQANLAMIAGETAAAEMQLKQVVAANGDLSAEALIQLIDAKIAARTTISYDTAQLAGAYAHEHQNTPKSLPLERAYLSALASAGAFDEAFGVLGEIKADHSGSEVDIMAPLFDLLVRNADDFTFLQHALNVSENVIRNLTPEMANSVAERLLSLGFLDEAQLYLELAPSGPSARERRLLQARIALGSVQPTFAEVALIGLSGEEVDELRARSLSMAGEHKTARALFEKAGLEEEAVREAWLEQDWPTLSNTEIPGLAAIAAKRAGPSNLSASRPSLSSGLAMIEESGETRSALEQMLQAFPLEAETD